MLLLALLSGALYFLVVRHKRQRIRGDVVQILDSRPGSKEDMENGRPRSSKRRSGVAVVRYEIDSYPRDGIFRSISPKEVRANTPPKETR